MATKYGSWGWHDTSTGAGWRSVLVYTTSETSTTYTINTTLKLQQVLEAYGDVKVTAKTSIGNSTSTKALPLADYAAGSLTTLMTKSRTYSKGTSAQSVTVSGQVDNSWGEQSTVSQSFTVPKLSYKVTYHANGGNTSSVPAAQTKVYGETLRLSSASPSRSGCSFIGWNTKADGTGTHYGPADDYTYNANLDLYAVWLGAAVPTLEVLRTDSSGTEADEGAYGKLTASWSAQGTLAATVAVTAYNNTAGSSITLSGNTSGTLAAGGTASGSVSSVFGGSLSTDTRYQILVRVMLTYDYNGSTHTYQQSVAAYVDLARITMDFHVGGDGVAFGKPSTAAGFEVEMEPIYLKVAPTHGTDGNMTLSLTLGSGVTLVNYTFRRWGKLAMLDLTWQYSSSISITGAGSMSTITVGTLATGQRPLCTAMGTDTTYGFKYSIGTNGLIRVGGADGIGSTRVIPSGTSLHLYATFVLA